MAGKRKDADPPEEFQVQTPFTFALSTEGD